jgi:hypothetical protein
MVIDDNAFVMLMKQERFRGFIAGATAAEVLMSLSAESREGPMHGPACRTRNDTMGQWRVPLADLVLAVVLAAAGVAIARLIDPHLRPGTPLDVWGRC